MKEITWYSLDRYRPRDYIEVWFEWQLDLEFTLVDPAGNRSSVVSFANPTVSVDLGGNFCVLRLTELHTDCGHPQLTITIVPNTAMIQEKIWKLEIYGKSALAGNRSVHAWVERDGSRAVRFLTGDNNAMTISIPGTAKHVITVSACGSKTPLSSPDFSSKGLTRDGRPKPELCAPGAMITAAHSN